MHHDSIKKNFMFQILYQMVVLVLPLIVAPIITRRMGSSSLGVYTYVNSVASYFVIFSNLGITKYGQRCISATKSDEIKLRKIFWSLFFDHVLISLIAIIIYIIFITLFAKENIIVYWINIFYVTSALFDITWLFYGLENFKSVVIKNFIVKIVVYTLIFFLIKTPNDLPLYTAIETLSLLIGNLVLVPTAIKCVKPISFNVADCVEHVKPLFVFSISVIAISLYTVFDKTLLGLMASKSEVAFYEYSNKIISIPKTFVSAISTVIFPRACLVAVKGDYKAQRKYANYATFIVCIIAFAAVFGLLAVGSKLVVLYYGDEFSVCGNIIKYLSPLILVLGFGEILRNIYLIPQKKDTIYVICIAINAIINLILSMLLIPYYGIYGAVIGTSAAELFGLIFQTTYCRNQIDFKYLLKVFITFMFIGVVMFVVIRIVSLFMVDNMCNLLIEILLGAIVYVLLSILATKFLFKDIWDKIMKYLTKFTY